MSSVQEFLDEYANVGVKIWLEDQRVRVRAAKGALTPDMQRQLKDRKGEVQDYLEDLYRKRAVVDQIPAAPRDQAPPLSFSQQRLWFLDQMEGPSPVYNMPYALSLSGPFDARALARAAETVVARHEVLRAVFPVELGRPVLAIQENQAVALPLVDLSGLHQTEVDGRRDACIQTFAEHPFRLERGPLLKLLLIRLAADRHLLLMNMHHIISDGWSIGILIRELIAAYEAISKGDQRVDLPPLPLQYSDYAYWERNRLKGETLQTMLKFWRGALAGIPELSGLPSDRPRPPHQSFQGDSVGISWSAELCGSLKRLARSHDTTLFTVLQAGLAALLHRYSGEADLVLGAPDANRKRLEIAGLIGFFVNTRVTRVDVSGAPSFTTLLERVKRFNDQAEVYGETPFEQIVEAVRPERNPAYNPLFQVMLALQNAPARPLNTAGLFIEPLPFETVSAKFDFTWILQESGAGLEGSLEYAVDLFDRGTVSRLVDHFHNLLQAAVSEPERPVSRLAVMGEDEQRRVLQEWNQTERALPAGSAVHVLFSRWLEHHAEAEALALLTDAASGEVLALTYAELARRSDRLAEILLAAGAKPGVLIGLCFPRVFDWSVSLLAVLKTGAAIVALDPTYPVDRLAYMFEDSGMDLLLTQAGLAEVLPPFSGVCLYTDQLDLSQTPSSNLNVPIDSTSLAYVIYTSGSTGRPKGAMLTHGGYYNLTFAQIEAFGTGPGCRVLQFAPLGFDAAVWEFSMSLFAGACLGLAAPDDLLPGSDLIQTINQLQITHVTLPPTAAGHMTPADVPGLQTLISAGEACTPDLIARYENIPHFINAYGPTECTVCATMDFCREAPVAIGRPLANTQVYILDRRLNLVPTGGLGELCIAGHGLARGYLGRPELTACAFVPHPFSQEQAGERLYKTGDLVRYLPNGRIMFFGRLDNQVKLRGFRIELGEIEAVMRLHEDVEQAVVLVSPAPNPRLAAFIESRSMDSELPAKVRAQAGIRLPEYMVPARFVVMAALPLTPAGKLDRRALNAMLVSGEVTGLDENRSQTAPRDETEQILAQIWSQLLRVDQVGVHDNFFELGGDSILSIQTVARAKQAGILFTARQLFENQTIAALARVAETGASTDKRRASNQPVSGEVHLTPIQAWFFERNGAHSHHFNQAVMLETAGDLPVDSLRRVFALLLEQHDMLRARFHLDGPVVRQEIMPPGGPLPFHQRDLADVPEDRKHEALRTASAEFQASLNLEQGPLCLLVYFTGCAGTPERSGRLLLVVHHLVVDGVSLRILLEDLQTHYNAVATGKEAVVQGKSTAFQSWAGHLRRYAESDALSEERDYWRRISQREWKPLPANAGPGLVGEAAHWRVGLDPAMTQALLRETSHAYQTRVDDLLLAALVRTLADWSGHRLIPIHLEGHGREELIEGVDLTRTVGWFTALYPVLFEAPEGDAGDLIKAIKEASRVVPNRGVGYGICRYLAGDPQLQTSREPDIAFNYLGRVDQVADAGAFRLATDDTGPTADPNMKRSHLFEINAIILAGKLELDWCYAPHAHDEATVKSLGASFIAELRRLIEHCRRMGARGRTPSDYPRAGLDQKGLDNLLRRVGDPEPTDIYPLTPMQEGMLFYANMAHTAATYVVQVGCEFAPPFDPRVFRLAWDMVQERLDVFRTSFHWKHLEQSLQVVHRKVAFPWLIEDWRGLSAQAEDDRLNLYLADERRRGFKSDQAPLCRFGLFQLNDGRYRFVWSMHHLLMDGWSLPIVFKEVLTCYQAGLKNEAVQLDWPRRFRDYVDWVQARDAGKAEQFWRESLTGFHTPTPLPFVGSGNVNPNGEFQRFWFQLDAGTTAKLNSLARNRRFTLSTALQAAWALILSRHTGLDDVLFGATVSGRPPELEGIEGMVGLLINSLPVRVGVDENRELLSWLGELQNAQVARETYAFTPVVRMRDWSDVPSHLDLFESLIIFENYPVDDALYEEAPGGVKLSRVVSEEQSVYPLTIIAAPGESLRLALGYYSGYFSSQMITDLRDQLLTVLTGFADLSDGRLAQIPMLGEAERARILVRWNESGSNEARRLCIHHMFESVVARHGDAPALIMGEDYFSYDTLNRAANRLAAYLRELGVGPDVPVALSMPRCFALYATLLGILKAGGAYVPLDPDYPLERLQFMSADSGAALLVTTAEEFTSFADSTMFICFIDETTARVEYVEAEDYTDDNPNVAVTSENLAYIIYTSGSTGQPKGVLVNHGGVAGTVETLIKTVEVGPGSRVLHFVSMSFDAASSHIFEALCSGSALCPVPDDHALAAVIPQTVRDLKVTQAAFPASLLASYTDEAMPSLQSITVGADACSPDLVNRWAPGRRFFNFYGPTEMSIVATTAKCEPGRKPLIGRPIDDKRAYVLDRLLRPVSTGVAAELCLAGSGLARGYLHRPDLTAAAFVPDPFAGTGERLYKTGDLVRFTTDGEIDFLGRIDHQVKVRGYRIELGEIEAALRSAPAVAEVVVLVREDMPGDKRIVAYLQGDPRDEALQPEALGTRLKKRLPAHMTPEAFVVMERFPLNLNGKIDREALPAPTDKSRAGGLDFTDPRDEMEQALASIWCEVLGVEKVGAFSDFFELGGHSLMATRVVSRINHQFKLKMPLETLFEHPVLAELADYLRDAEVHDIVDSPRSVPRDGVLPLSFAQERLWFLNRMEAGGAYNMPASVHLHGHLSVPDFERSVAEIVDRHEVLRTIFPDRDGQASLEIAPAVERALSLVDLSGLSTETRDAEVARLSGWNARKPFDLTCGQPLRVALTRLSAHHHYMLAAMHHIVSDGWSISIFVRELSAVYSALVQDREPAMQPPAIQYVDFAAWQRQRLNEGLLEEQIAYWRERLAAPLPALQLPVDFNAPDKPAQTGAICGLQLAGEINGRLNQLARSEECTLFMVLLTSFAVVIHRLSGQDDLVIGTPSAGRDHASLEDVIGCFLNTLAIRIKPTEGISFRHLLRQVRETTLEAFGRQDVPFEKLVEVLQPERRLNRHPIFDVMLNMVNIPSGNLTLPGLELTQEGVLEPDAKFQMTLYAGENEAGLNLQLCYQKARFSAARMTVFLNQLACVLEGVADDADVAVAAYSLVDGESSRLLPNPTHPLETQTYSPITEVFAGWAERTPNHPAIVWRGRELSYADLLERSRQIALHLRAQGLREGDVVALISQRTPGLIAGLLGVLMAGGVILPISRDLPNQRAALMRRESGAAFSLICDGGDSPDPDAIHIDPMHARIPGQTTSKTGALPTIETDAAAYVFFTSGSTGKPKGVLGRHNGLSHFLDWQRTTFEVGPRDRCALLTGLSFDVVLRDIFLPLTAGACLCPPDDRETMMAGGSLLKWLAETEITVLHTVPSLVSAWLSDSPRGLSLPALRFLFFAGEPLPQSLIFKWRRFFPGQGAVVNFYGPTETTLAKCFHLVDETPTPGAQTVGHAIPGAQALVWSVDNRLCGVGETGEVVIRTPYRSLGYLNPEPEDAARFTPNPYSGDSDDLVYRTGDLGRYRPDGSLELLGRLDFQVKIRGIRVEPGEVASALLRHEAVSECVVVARETKPGDLNLAAYLCLEPGQKAVSKAALQHYLRGTLVEAMVPRVFVFMERLPLNANGKVDRAALPEPQWESELETGETALPCNQEEEVLAAIWAEVLDRQRVDVNQDFFELGGHSLLATRVVARVRDAFNLELPIRSLFEAPTVAQLADTLRGLRLAERGLPPIETIDRAGDLPLSFAQERMWFIHQLDPSDSAYNMSYAFNLKGRLDITMIAACFREIFRRHETLRTVFYDVDGSPRQRIQAAVELQIPLVDVSGLSDGDRNQTIWRLLEQSRVRPFDLSRDVLFRLALVLVEPEHCVLLANMHHIVADAWSVAVFVRETALLYTAFSEGAPSPLDHLPIQYVDFAAWQRKWFRDDLAEQQIAYWRRQLAGVPALHDLPLDRPRPTEQSFNGASEHFAFDPELSAALHALSRRFGASLFMVLNAAFAVLVHRYSRASDIVFGTPVANRLQRELESLIGFFVNTLVLRYDVVGNPSFEDLLQRVRRTALDAYAHQEVPFERVVEAMQPERNLSHTPLFQIMVIMQNVAITSRDVPGLTMEPLPDDRGKALFDLTLILTEDANQISGVMEYNRDLFLPATVRRLLGHFHVLADQICKHPGLPITRLPLMGDAERACLLGRICNGGMAPTPSENLVTLLEGRARMRADAGALRDPTGQTVFTYGELDRTAAGVAADLRRLGVGPERVAAVYCERSAEAIIAMSAVLKAAGTFLMIDVDLPAERVAYILENAAPAVLLTTETHAHELPVTKIPVLTLNAVQRGSYDQADPIDSTLSPDNLAYLVYTSGSTGRPKAVGITHGGLLNHAFSVMRNYRLDEDDRVLQFAGLAFDVAVEEIIPTFLSGAALVLRDQAMAGDYDAFDRFLIGEGLTVLNLPAGFWHGWVEHLARTGGAVPDDLRLVVAGSEEVSIERVNQWYQIAGERVEWRNGYGPSETTITASLFTPQLGCPLTHGPVPIGRPIHNLRAYICDADLNALPVGVPGELCLAGNGLARGYLGEAARTATAFVPDPFAITHGERLYRTGDLARFDQNEQLLFLGRVDDQIKLRGFRVEPGEITNLLLDHDAVREAVVIGAREKHGAMRLSAYVVPSQNYAENPIGLWPSIGEYPLYDDILYHAMTHDIPRNERYIAAIQQAVAGKVVLDIGTGKDALLARFCVEAGAKKVYAFELMDTSYEQAGKSIAAYGMNDKITLIHGASTGCELPEPVDVCVSEIIGTIGGSEGAAFVLDDARRRFLKPEGVMIPSRCITKIAGVSLPDDFAATPHFDELGAYYAGEIFEHFQGPCEVRLCLKNLPQTAVMTSDGILEDLRFEAGIETTFTHVNELLVTRDDRLDGFLLWLNLYTSPDHLIDNMSREYSWLPAYFPVFHPGVEVKRGERIELVCKGRLCENGINMDYSLEGVIHHTDGARSPFRFDSPHTPRPRGGDAFFNALFDGDDLRIGQKPKTKNIEALLREDLKTRLPDYMVPAEILVLDRLPRTPGGKIDRSALLRLRGERVSEKRKHVAPRNRVERELTRVWADVLKLDADRIGVEDNFFELGGDSILCIQIVSRAQQKGIRLLPKNLFEHQTIAGLCGVVGKNETQAVLAEQGLVTGPLPLTPVMQWFFESETPNRNHYNQSLFLKVEKGLKPEILKEAFRHLAEHHDMLRARFSVNGSGCPFASIDDDAGRAAVFELIEVADQAAMEQAAAAIQAGLDLGEGPLCRAVLFRLEDTAADRLLIAIHHLVVDGISWRILLEDLAGLYRQLDQGQKPNLPAKTSAFKAWAERLVEYAAGEGFQSDLNYWIGQPTPKHNAEAWTMDTGKTGRAQCATRLDLELTEALLRQVPQAFNTQINDVLLTALTMAFSERFGAVDLLVEMEGHGREDLFDELDISRTVGWFTSAFPVVLTWEAGTSPIDRLKLVKEHLRQLPNNGVGFGIARYLHPDEDVRLKLSAFSETPILFNYLGQMDQALSEAPILGPAPESAGPIHAPGTQSPHLFELNAVIAEGSLHLGWTYDAAKISEATALQLSESMNSALSQLIGLSTSGELSGYTPSDFPLARIDQAGLEWLVDQAPDMIDLYPLSPMQEGMLFHSLYESGMGAYFEQISCVIRGDLDGSAFERAWREVMTRHDILRTSFRWSGLPRALQMVHRQPVLEWRVEDWRDRGLDHQQADLETFLAEDRATGFQLDQLPLTRFALFRLDEKRVQFTWSHHHMLLDGWAVGLVLAEVFNHYRAFTTQQAPTVAKPAPFRAYIAWLAEQDHTAAETFWREHLNGFEESTPIGVERPGGRLNAGYDQQVVTLDANLTNRLNEFARTHHLTMNTIVQGAFALLLCRYANRDDVVYGTTVSGRPADLPQVEAMIGLFINTLPARVRLKDVALVGWLQELQRRAAILDTHAYSPLNEIQRLSALPAGTPLFECLYVFENYPIDASLAQPQSELVVENSKGYATATHPLTLVVMPRESLMLRLDYEVNRFSGAFIDGIPRHLTNLLKGILTHTHATPRDLPLLDQAERRLLLQTWSCPDGDAPEIPLIHGMFAQQAGRVPDAVASFFHHEDAPTIHLTYRQLNQAAERLAQQLRLLGVGPDSVVGVMTGKSAELALCVWGLLKAGGVYLPLEPALPEARNRFILNDAAASVLLLGQGYRDALPDFSGTRAVVDLKGGLIDREVKGLPREQAEITPQCCSYIIYTSGSTGQPKGVQLTHRGLTAFSLEQRRHVSIEPGDSVLQVASLAFDISLWDLILAFASGATLRLSDSANVRPGVDMGRTMLKLAVTHIMMTPIAAEHLPDGPYPHLKMLAVGGEVCKPELAARFNQACRFINAYGPSETTIGITAEICLPDTDKVTLGHVLRLDKGYVLDQRMEPVPVGVIGEIYAGGAGLARGYSSRPDLTAEQFIPNPHAVEPGERLYKTGDLATFNADGRLEFLGRRDNQIKLRGFRIELDEIETALLKHPAIDKAVVVLHEEAVSGKRLLAYLKARDGNRLQVSDLRAFLGDGLPDFMIPAFFVYVDDYHYTDTGKVDRRAMADLPLPADAVQRASEESLFVAPRGPEERLLVEIWREVLGVGRVGVTDNYYELGGDSILAIRIVAKAKQAGLGLTLQQFFQEQSIEGLARLAVKNEAGAFGAQQTKPFELVSTGVRAQLPADVIDAYPLTKLQEGMLFYGQMAEDAAHYHNVHGHHLVMKFDEDAFRRCLNQVIERHPILRTSFDMETYDEPLQLVWRQVAAPLIVEDWRELPETEKQTRFDYWFQAEEKRWFQHTDQCQLRVQVHLWDARSFWFTISMNHAILDGWSSSLMITEMFDAYFSFLRGVTEPERENVEPPPFRDFVALERAALTSPTVREHWRETLTDMTFTKVPRTAKPHSKDESREMHRAVSPELYNGLDRLAKRMGVPLKTLLLAAHMRVLGVLANQSDVVTGLIVNGRAETEGGDRVLGLFLNTLPFRLQMNGGSWLDLIGAVFERERADLPYRRFPMVEMRCFSDNDELFETSFNYTHFHALEKLLDFEEAEVLEGRTAATTNFTLGVDFSREVVRGGLRLMLEFEPRLLRRDQVERVADYYLNVLQAMSREPESRYEHRVILGDDEWRELTALAHGFPRAAPPAACVHRVFERVAQQRAEAPCLFYENSAGELRSLSYRELNHQADRLALRLQAGGVRRGDVVGILCRRSPEMTVAMLAVLKSGGAYLPLDPTYPASRLQLMLKDARPSIVLHQDGLEASISNEHAAMGIGRIEPRDKTTCSLPAQKLDPNDLAYLIYTSGSTGVPKGVAVTHGNLVNHNSEIAATYELNDRDRVLQFAGFSFDVAAEEMYPTWLAGGAVVLQPPEKTADFGEFETFLAGAGISVLNLPAAFWHEWVHDLSRRNQAPPVSLRLLVVGSDRVMPERLLMWRRLAGEAVTVFNGYGPTEATITATIHRVQNLVDEQIGSVPIGKPVGNTRVYVVDPWLNPVPMGTPGELLIGGYGPANGYRGYPALTAERFVPDPFADDAGARLYRTGDLVRFLPDGALDFLGRNDHQVKIRGFRIEPGEVENVLMTHPDVREAAVLVAGERDKHLTAHLSLKRAGENAHATLKAFLQDCLPDYMVPATFHLHETLPKTTSGKIDRRELAESELQATPATAYVPPNTATESELAAIWAEVLDREKIGVHDNFFDLGGHSLSATRVITRVRALFQVKLPLARLFDQPTIAGLAELIDTIRWAAQEPVQTPADDEEREEGEL